nr:hypothetical protein [Actinomadura nitritigenes]
MWKPGPPWLPQVFLGVVRHREPELAVEIHLVGGHGTELAFHPLSFLFGLVDPLGDVDGVGTGVQRRPVLGETLVTGGELFAEPGLGRVLRGGGLLGHRRDGGLDPGG